MSTGAMGSLLLRHNKIGIEKNPYIGRWGITITDILVANSNTITHTNG